jgi:lipoprotein-anchoring transpeptidase ErfK/SrfK
MRLLLLAPAALALGTARPPAAPAQEAAPSLPYGDLRFGADELTYSLVPDTPAPAPAASPAEPPESAVKVVVSIPQQRAFVFKAGELVASAPVSTGRRGHPTPVGTFRILEKQVHHRSNIYSNAPMPYMQRLTTYGIALHAGPLPGYPASHGCIRLPLAFAKRLYAMTDTGTRVTVTREPVRVEPDSEAADE